ncbi:MAG: OmpA family protein [Alphaproteobacteria bacterium]
MKRKQLFMSVTAAALCAAFIFNSNPAQAQQAEVGSIAYLPSASIYQIEPAAGGDVQASIEKDRRHWARFFEYEHREHCQSYVPPPAGWTFKNCQLERVGAMQVSQTVTQIEPAAGPTTIVESYEPRQHMVYFNFDRDDIRPSEQQTIITAASDILNSRASLVTVDGHADAAGSNAYNMDLSARRAQTIENALVANGVNRSIIETKHHGEENLAVQTPDGVPEQANRRASIIFVPTVGTNRDLNM